MKRLPLDEILGDGLADTYIRAEALNQALYMVPGADNMSPAEVLAIATAFYAFLKGDTE